MKFLIAVFLPASPFINFGDFCQPPRLLFWPKFANLLVYSALPFYLKLESRMYEIIVYEISYCFSIYIFLITLYFMFGIFFPCIDS